MKRILLVDDDSAVRRVVASFIREAGHEVHEAQSPDEAFQAWATSPPFDALVSDVEMPGMTGPQLWDRLRQPPTVFITGKLSLDDLPSGVPVVRKPMTASQINAALDGLLQ